MNKHLLLKLVAVAVILLTASFCYANSAEPPSIVILVPNPPPDLEITILANNQKFTGRKTEKGFEHQYTFFYGGSGMQRLDTYILLVRSAETVREIPLSIVTDSYNNLFTLHLEQNTLTPGKLFSRSVALVSLRVLLTLLIEGLLFLLFGFRQKHSWLVFGLINLVTQGLLNVWINGSGPLIGSYFFLALVFMEVLIIAVEIPLFITLVKEHSPRRKILYVIAANLASFIAGGYIITILPV